MHFFNSNIPSEIFYSLIGSDALHIARGTSDRLARGTSDRLTFMILVNKLSGRMSKQGSQKSDTIIFLNQIFGGHFEVSSKSALTAKGFRILFEY